MPAQERHTTFPPLMVGPFEQSHKNKCSRQPLNWGMSTIPALTGIAASRLLTTIIPTNVEKGIIVEMFCLTNGVLKDLLGSETYLIGTKIPVQVKFEK